MRGRTRSAGMLAAGRPEWLPEGWKSEIAAADGGADGLVYTCLDSGCKFTSKEEVMAYLKNEKNDDHVSKATSCGDKSNDSFDWLPTGWVLDVKTRNKGATAGRQDKIFIDPLTKSKFYSKTQVCRYLQSVNSCSPSRKKDVNVDSGGNASTLTSLKSRVNTRSSNNSVNSCSPTTKKDVIVKSDDNASTLTNQKRIVFAKSINTNGSSCSPTTKDVIVNSDNNALTLNNHHRIVGAKSTNNVGAQTESTVNGLPPGWIKEVRHRKNGRGKDPFYIDPVSGYEFRSLKDVFRYLSCGNVNKCAIEPRKRNINDAYAVGKESLNGSSCSPTTKNVILNSDDNVSTLTNQRRTVDAKSTDNVGAQTESTVNGLPPGWIKEVRHRKNGHGKDPYYIDPVSGYEFRSLKDVFRYLSCGDVNKCAIRPTKRSVNSTFIVGKKSHPSPAESKLKSQRTAVKRSLFSEEIPGPKAKMPRDKDDSRKGSEQLETELKPMQLEIETKPNKRGRGRKRRGRPKGSTFMSEGDLHLEKRASERQPSSRKRKGLNAITMPLRASKRLAALRDEKIAGGSVVETKLSDQLQENQTDKNIQEEPNNVGSELSGKLKSKKPLGEQATTGKQVESAGVITDEAEPEQPLSSLLFADPLLDPCIEFALKTLTSDIPDIPVSENNATFEGFLHQHLSPNKDPATNCSASTSENPNSFGQAGNVG